MDFGSSRCCTRPSILFFRDGLDPFLSLNRRMRNFSTPKFICTFVPTLDLFWNIFVLTLAHARIGSVTGDGITEKLFFRTSSANVS